MSFEDREFDFSDKDFKYIVGLVSEKTGIVLADHKKPMVYSRLARRIRALKMKSFKEYLDLVGGDKGESEIVDFVNAITTNLTSFFREPHHFEHLAEEVLKPLSLKPPAQKRFRIWSAGCSSGMEPYTLSMVINYHLSQINTWDAKILATDIDTNMVETGKAGQYPIDMLEKIPSVYRKGIQEKSDTFEMSNQLKKLITYKQFNLLHEFPMRGPFDVIFCRNVVIYFDKPTQRVLFEKFANVIKPGGFMYIGHSENLFKVSDKFKLIGKTIYQRI